MSCKDGASKSSDVGVCEMNDMLHMNIADEKDKINTNTCANCGKVGSDINNTCNKCKQVKYCNAACKKVHKKKHKKDCEEYIRLAIKKHDEKLFEQPPLLHEDCPICFLRMPSLAPTGYKYYACCGKVVCSGCCYAPVYDNQGNKVEIKKCPYCRTPPPKSNEEMMKRIRKRVEAGDANAMFNLGCDYADGRYGLPQDYNKALELWHRAAEVGHAKAYTSIGYAYDFGNRGLEVDKKKAIHYYELGAMRGYTKARDNLGSIEVDEGNFDRAIKHFLIAIESGDTELLEEIQRLYSDGHVTKEDYTQALRSYQEYLDEIKSPQRDEAAAANEKYRYY